MEINQSQNDKIQKELEEQTKLLKSIRNSLRMGTYLSILRVVIILIPLILAFIYLPALYQRYSAGLKDTLIRSGDLSIPADFDFTQIQKLFER